MRPLKVLFRMGEVVIADLQRQYLLDSLYPAPPRALGIFNSVNSSQLRISGVCRYSTHDGRSLSQASVVF